MKSQFEQIESDALRVGNVIQMDLARMHIEKMSITADEFGAWTEKYSARFRELIDARPELLALYVQSREKALHEIEEELYKEGV